LLQFIDSDRHTTSINPLEYYDTLARDLGVKPTLGKILKRAFTYSPLRALSILNFYYNGMLTSAPYRLFGQGSKPQIAEATILRMARKGKTLSKEEQTVLAADR
jgi:dimethylaniline monooxygenase (N-oxide forming)